MKMAAAMHVFRLLSKIILFTALQHYYGVSVVNAGYSNAYGPLTCLCADRNFYTFDSSVVVRQFGCSLFDYCEKCTDNEHQPCVSCPPNRYGPKCEKECDCGYQPCDDGIYGDGECLCSTDDLREGGRCEQLVSSQRKLKEDEYFPAPQVSVDSSKILLSWQLLWFQSDPIVRYDVQYKFADRVSSRYGRWAPYQSTSSANQTYEIFQYQPTETDGYYKFRINGVHFSNHVTKGVSTSAVKVPGTPEAPEAVQINSIEGNTVTIKWSDPPEDFVHGNEITGYIVQYQLYGFLSSWITVADAKFEEKAVTIHDLQPLKIYRFRVAARNKLGIGSWSSEQTMMLPNQEDSLECYTREDGSDYRGRISNSKSGNKCKEWSEAAQRWFFAYGRLSGPWNHSYCRNPEGMWGSARCWTENGFIEDCNIGEPQGHCPKVCAAGMVLSNELCVEDDQTEIYNRVPLLNGEVCTCALQIKDGSESEKYIEPRSFVGWTYACAHAVGNDAQTLIDNIYNMDADVCYEECLKSGCSAYTYSTNGYNEYGNETDIRLCTLFTDMYTPVVVEKHANWTSYLEQEVPDDTDFILTWGCWAASDPRNPGDKWRNLGLENFMVFRNPAFKNYSVNIYMTEGPSNGLNISLMINGTLNTTTPMIFFVKPGNQQFYVINRNVGFVTALKIVGQIGNQITLETVEVQLDNIITEFSCQWCGDSDFYKMDRIKECRAKGTLGGHMLPNTRVIMPTTTTILSEYHGFACTSMAYSTAYNEAFFGWCPLPPKLVSIGVPAEGRRPPFLLEVGESEDIYRRRKRDTKEKDGTYLIIEDKTFTWQEAVDACLQMGKMIVKVFDDDILQGVENAISEQGLTGNDFWINGYNEGTGATLWRTHDKHALSVKDELWAEGQPDFSGKCLQVRYKGDVHGYRLDDTLCNIRKRAICETQSAARSSDCKANNDIFANTECVAMLNFQVNSLRNENLEDMSVIVESTKLSITFRGERHIRYLALEAISDPWTRISVSNTSIPRSVLIDTIDTNTTSKLQISIESERLRKLVEELLNGKFVTGRYGFMLRPLKDQQQAGFDDIIVWKQSSLRPTLKLQIKLFKWLVGPWSSCEQNGCLGGIQTRELQCVAALNNLPTDEKFCKYKLRPHTNQSCVYHYIASCYQWKFRPRAGSSCAGANKCGRGTVPAKLLCENKETERSVPEYYCSYDKPDEHEVQNFPCSDFTECSYSWRTSGWSDCSEHCGGGVLSRSTYCIASNGSYVSESMCPPSEKPLATEKCQDYSDCNVWQSLQLLRQDQIYSERSLIHRQINLTLPGVQAEADLIGAKHDIAERELGFNLQRIRANLSIPEQVAKAELLEAKARQSLAKNTIEVPADGKTSFPNIGYLGRGYDIYYGNPRNDDGSVDPGFRQAVIGLTYDKVRLSSDRLFLMPDQADVIREMGSHFSSRTTIITSERSYKSSLDLDVSVEVSVGIGSFSGGFSASTSYRTMTQSTINTENVFVDVTGRVIVYDARLTPFNTEISNEFKDAVRNLPAISCCTYSVRCHVDCGFYDDFIAAFGTHYATRVLMGGKATQRYQMTKEEMEKQQENDNGFKFKVSAGVKGIAEFSSGVSSKISNSMRESLSQSDKSSIEFFLGGEAGVGQISEGNTDSMKEWASTVFDNPVPIQYTLRAVVDLLTQENFPNDKKIETKQSVLRARYQGYCNRIPNARCSDFSKRTGDENGNSVHYGDIVHITMSGLEKKVYFLRDDGKEIRAESSSFKQSSTTTKASIIPLQDQLCTWVQQESSGPKNPYGKDWVKFMKDVHEKISSKCAVYEDLSQDDCEDYCKQKDGCQAGTFTSNEGGFCILFTSQEQVANNAYYEKKNFWGVKKKKAYDYTFHWSCYTDKDREHFGNVWDELQLKSFRPHFRIITDEQSKLFTIVSPLAIMNVEREELHYGDPFTLVAAAGIVTRNEDEENYHADNTKDKSNPLRFRAVNDYKPNGMPVKFGDILRFQEANRFQETLLMEDLPYYLTIEEGGSDKRCSGQRCSETQTLSVKKQLLCNCEQNTFTWTISRADVKSLIPEFNEQILSGIDRVEYSVHKDKMSVEADIFFTRPVRRKNSIPGTVVDKTSSVTSLPGYDGRDIISSDFLVTLKRGNSTVLKPIKQRFLFQGRDLTEYRLGIYFRDTLKDGDILTVELSDEIVSEEEDELGGQTTSEYQVYMEPTYTAHVSDATSLLTGKEASKNCITVRVTFDKPVVNAEREVPDIYDFEIADMNNETMPEVILTVETVDDCEILTQCSKEFDLIIEADFLKGQTHFYFDVTSGRVKSAKDFLFVREKQIKLDLQSELADMEKPATSLAYGG